VFGLTLPTVIFSFYLFSFYGWLFELWLEIIAGRGLVNRGFLYGPWIPIYSLGIFGGYAVGLSFKQSPILVFLVSSLACTMLEQITGWLLERFLNLKAWDYNIHPFTKWCNYKGHIALTASATFGAGSMLMVYFGWEANRNLMRLLWEQRPGLLLFADVILSLAFAADMFFSLKKYINNKRKGISNKTKGIL